MENVCQNGFKNDTKINILELGGLIFEILGGFWRRRIFEEFLICKKYAKNHKNQRLWRPNGLQLLILGRPGGMRGVGGGI